jgi:hypothetical protein
MARGRKPKPAKIIEMQGPVAHRPDKPEPASAPGALQPNADFDKDALAAWDFWTGQMAAAGMSFPIDSIALQAACFAYSRAIRAERMLKVDPKDWRADVSATRNWKQVKDFATEFGLTLVSRNKVVTANPQMRLDLELEAALNA